MTFLSALLISVTVGSQPPAPSEVTGIVRNGPATSFAAPTSEADRARRRIAARRRQPGLSR